MRIWRELVKTGRALETIFVELHFLGGGRKGKESLVEVRGDEWGLVLFVERVRLRLYFN